MKKILFATVLLTAVTALGQGAQRIAQATINSGGFVKVLPGAEITVCTYNVPLVCTATVSIYGNATLTLPLSNPFQADANGNYNYYVAPGQYVERISAAGAITRSLGLTFGGGAVSAVTASAPLVSSGGPSPNISISSVQGNGSKVQLASGATTTGDCVQYDANGNATDAGSPCGTGAGSGTVNPSPQFEVPYYDQSGSIASVSGAVGVSVDAPTQTVLQATGGFNAGSAPPAACTLASGCFSGAETTSYGTPTSGVDILQADQTNHTWLLSTNGNPFAPLVTSATAPLAISSTGVMTVAAATSSTFGTVKPDNVTVTISGGVLTSVGGGGGGSGSFSYFQTPTGSVNGVNTTFVLGSTPSPSSSLTLMLDGLILLQGSDYTLSGATITMTTTVPRTGDTIRATYQTASAGTYSWFEVPTGSINSTNLVFTLAHTPSPGTSVTLVRDGQTLVQGSDYTLSTATITFVAGSAPRTGDNLTATYTY